MPMAKRHIDTAMACLSECIKRREAEIVSIEAEIAETTRTIVLLKAMRASFENPVVMAEMESQMACCEENSDE